MTKKSMTDLIEAMVEELQLASGGRREGDKVVGGLFDANGARALLGAAIAGKRAELVGAALPAGAKAVVAATPAS